MDPDESERWGRILGGDEAAQAELVHRLGPRMLASARRILLSEEDARDAVREAFLRAFGEVAQLERARELDRWLHGIVVDVCLAKLRPERSGREPAIEALLPRFDATGHRIEPAPLGRRGEPGAESEPSGLVRACIAQLPEIYRIVLLLRDVEGLSTEEAARALGLETEAVKRRLHRARQAMVTLLRPHLAEGSG